MKTSEQWTEFLSGIPPEDLPTGTGKALSKD